MNQQFGEQTDSCSLFNELMGIMSGAFDGVMDFMDAGLDKIIELLGPVTSVITDITAGIIGAIASGITAIVDAISNMIPQGIKDIFNQIGNIAKSMMNGISALANQITSEIANLTSMAASISAKLAALALASATLDPCKLAVLLNTGSPELKSAAQNMTSPVTNVVPTIATELDPRANAIEVNAAIQSAKQTASTAVGVPQSPMTASAKLYSPFDAYLHDIEENFASIFGTDDAFGTNPTTSGGKIVSKLPETGSTSNTSDKEISTSNATREFESNAFVTWKSKFLNDLMLTRTKSDKIKNDIKLALNGGAYFPNSALKDEATSISADASDTSNKIKSHVILSQSNLSYTSETGKRDNFEEQEALLKYNNIYSTRTASLVERVIRDTNTAESRWNSIRSQVIYNAPR